jgi:6-pyruvoyltetrahydropterin/6-carboxytetrahydropterin synthase
MFALTREVRLAIGPVAANDLAGGAINGHAGYPGGGDLEHFFTVQVTLGGEVDPVSGYLMNIKQIDQAVRRDGVGVLQSAIRENQSPQAVVKNLYDRLAKLWPQLSRVRIGVSPYTAVSVEAREYPMVRFNRKFEFSAAHRLHNPQLDAKTNVELFGKCNNPHGHGHNYEVEVSVRGEPIAVGLLDEIVIDGVISRFDHKFLNLEVAEFANVNPTVENIARTIYGLLRSRISAAGSELASVTVWETPKTWCEYWE